MFQAFLLAAAPLGQQFGKVRLRCLLFAVPFDNAFGRPAIEPIELLFDLLVAIAGSQQPVGVLSQLGL